MDCNWVTFIDYKDYQGEYDALGKFIREEMAHSRAVVLRGYPYLKVPLDADEIWRKLKISPLTEVVVSGITLIFFL